MSSQPISDNGMYALAVEYAALLNHPEQRGAWLDIAGLIDAVRRCQSLDNYRSVQEALALHISRVDAARNAAHMRERQANRRLRDLAKGGGDSDQRAQAETDHRAALFDEKLYKRLGAQYRTVGDALAWQLYRFNTLALAALGLNQSAGPTAGKAGAPAEASAVKRHWDENGEFALRHDFTNVLRIWDLSVFKPDGSVDIEEVKLAEGRELSSKQKDRGRVATQLVREHAARWRDGAAVVHRGLDASLPDGVAHTNLALFQEAILEADDLGVGIRANDYLQVMVVDHMHPVWRSSADKLAQQERQREFMQEPWRRIGAPQCRVFLFANADEKVIAAGKGAPYSVYPLFPLHAAGIITGYLSVTVVLNTEAVTQALRDAGMKVTCFLDSMPYSHDLKRIDTYYEVSGSRGKVLVHTPLIQQLLFEGLRLEQLVALLRTDVVGELGSASADSDVADANVRVGEATPVSASAVTADIIASFAELERVWAISCSFLTPKDSAIPSESIPEDNRDEV